MKKNILISTALAVSLISAMVYAQQDQSQHQQMMGQGHSMPMMDMAKCKKDMMEGEARLNKLVVKMDAAKGAAKVNAVANTVKEMIAQEKAMYQMCMQMMENMHGNMKPAAGTEHKHGG